MTTLQSPRRYSVKSASCAQLWLVRRYLDRVIWLARRYHDNGWPPVLHNTERQGSKHKMHILVQLTFLWNALRHWTIPRCQVKLWHADSFWPCYSPLCTCHDSRFTSSRKKLSGQPGHWLQIWLYCRAPGENQRIWKELTISIVVEIPFIT